MANQLLYSRGKEFVWPNEENYGNAIFRIGGLHVCFSFLKAIGQHIGSSGLDYVRIEYGDIAPYTSETVLERKAYYRAVRGHMLAYQSLWRFLNGRLRITETLWKIWKTLLVQLLNSSG